MAAVQLALDINAATAIVSALTGKGGLAEQVLELLTKPLNVVALGKSITIALQFVAQNPPTAPHITYEWRPVTADGRTGIQYAVDHLGAIAAVPAASLTVKAAAWAICWVGIAYSPTSVAAAFTLAWRNRR